MRPEWHPDAQELLDLAMTGKGPLEVREHIFECDECADDYALLKRPMLSPPEWATVKKRGAS